MKLKGFLTNRKYYFSWLVSYFLFIVLFLIGVSVMMSVSKNVLEDEIFNANNATFNTIRANLDSIKADMDKLAVNLASDESVARFVGKATDYSSVYEIRESFNRFWKTYDYIDGVCVLNRDEERMIIDGGLMSAADGYRDYTIRRPDGNVQTYAQWLEFMSQPHVQEIYQTDNGNLVYVQTIQSDSGSEVMGAMIFTFGQWKMYNLISTKNLGDGKSFLLLNQDDEVVFQSKKSPVVELFEQKEIELSVGAQSIEVDGARMEVFISGIQSNLRCVFAISENVFWEPLNHLYGIIFLLAVGLLLIGVLMAVLFVNHHYSPIAALTKLIARQRDAGDRNNDEYEYIETYLTNMLQQAKESEKRQRKYRNETFQNHFISCLKERGSVKELFERYQTPFVFESYVILLLSVVDISDYFGMVELDNAEERELIELAITNVLGEMLENCRILSVPLGNNLFFCLLGTKSVSPDLEVIQTRAAEAQTFLRENLGIYYTVSGSGLFHDLSEITRAYMEALDTSNYGRNAERDVLFYSDVNWSNQKYEYTLEMEKQLMSFIRSGDEKCALIQIEQLCNMDSAQMAVAKRLMWLKHDLCGTFLNLVRSEQLEQEFDAAQWIGAIERSESAEELKESIETATHQLCALYQADGMDQKQGRISEQIKEFVIENFSNPDLNVNLVGQHFERSPSHLSKLFKEQAGELLRDFITRTRLSHAELLLATDQRLEDVALACGFVELNSFIRAFKKQYGITPGKYREGLG